MLGLKLAGAPHAWWPDNAVFAADFVNRRYMRAGTAISEGEAITFSRASAAWADDGAGGLLAFGIDEPRFARSGLLLEPTRTRLSLMPVDIGGPRWSSSGGATVESLPAEGLFAAPARIFSGGFEYSRRNSAAMALAVGAPVHVKVRYRTGTSTNFGIYMRSNTANLQSVLAGPLGGQIWTQSSDGGSWSNLTSTSLSDGSFALAADFTPSSAQSDWLVGLSPRSSVIGEFVDVLGAELVQGSGPSTWILGEGAQSFERMTETLGLALPTGAGGLLGTFADLSMQNLVVSGGITQIFASDLNSSTARTMVVV